MAATASTAGFTSLMMSREFSLRNRLVVVPVEQSPGTYSPIAHKYMKMGNTRAEARWYSLRTESPLKRLLKWALAPPIARSTFVSTTLINSMFFRLYRAHCMSTAALVLAVKERLQLASEP